MAFYGSSRKWSDSTWTHGKQLVFVVFPNSAGRIANSTNPITRFSG